MFKTAHIIKTCNKFEVPCILENPSGSMLFQAHPIRKLLGLSSSQSTTIDQCQYGTRWRKRTRLAAWNCTDMSSLCKLCTGHKGICSLTHKPHILLQGKSPQGPLWTSIAQEYPRKLCSALASVLIESFENRFLRRMSYFCGLSQSR